MPFILDRPNSDEPTYIFFLKQFPDGRLKYPVKAKVHPTNWSKIHQRAVIDKENINTILQKLDLTFKDLQLQSRLHGKPLTKAGTEKAFDKALGRIIAGQSFYEVIDKIIEDRETGKELTDQGKRFSPHTIKGYRHTRDNLHRFDPNLTFESISMNTYHSLIAFYNGPKYNHSINAIGKTIKNWIVFMKAAKRRGAHENLVHLDEDFRVPVEQTDDVYLTEKELKKIYEHNFINKTLDLVRDWFIIDCYTGLRISDIQLLQASNLQGSTIQIMNEKTDTKVVVPLNSMVRAIIKKHKGLPRKISDQKMNENLKKVGELAGINHPFLYSVTKGGVRQDQTLKKWEMISNHTGRRTFITNLLNAGIPDNQVMQLAGIKKHATLLRYKKTKPEETAELLKEHAYFK
jgi:integrase